MKPLNRYIDHTLLKAEATEADIRKLCKEAIEYDFYAVCVNSCYVSLVSKELADSGVKVASVVGFPLGAAHTAAKVCETEIAVSEGADEIDMVLNIGALKEGRYNFVEDDIRAVVQAAAKGSAIVKVILETCLLTDDEVIKACQLAQNAGAAFVKTSTGFSTGGATAHHVKLMKDTVGDALQVKASGGIRDKSKALEMIEAGADRIGASASVAICK
ncbi:MAG TPA: deoxyribose-phosphate aldolase [Bacillota bacterium]|jgi:deoxyribose-phosphate aldolase|nr:deoxyribose-phosphate aldolase [Bacillota bacterium]HQC81937.1 deoxyribose-phosphate aldolase [Bacillota bacterium]